MRADGRDEQSWNLGMDKGSTGRERVCRGSSRGRYSQAISLDRGQVVLVTYLSVKPRVKEMLMNRTHRKAPID